MAKRNKDLHYQQAQASRMKFLRFELMKRAESIEENDDRTLEVVFSSDADVEMWYGKERLLHGTDNVDLSYLNAGMSPLLVDHRAYNSDNQIGVIESWTGGWTQRLRDRSSSAKDDVQMSITKMYWTAFDRVSRWGTRCGSGRLRMPTAEIRFISRRNGCRARLVS